MWVLRVSHCTMPHVRIVDHSTGWRLGQALEPGPSFRCGGVSPHQVGMKRVRGMDMVMVEGVLTSREV